MERVYNKITFNSKQFYHINGHACASPPGHFGDAFKAILSPKEFNPIIEGANLYEECVQTGKSDIRYAWEDKTNSLLDNLNDLDIVDIDQLIVIGYSFPYFNKDIDKKILSQMQNLKKIFLQFPKGVHDSIRQRIQSFNIDCEIIDIDFTDLFYIPDNLF